MGLHTLTITTRNDDHKASHLGWLTWILIFPLSVKCQRLSVVVVRGKIGEHSGQDQLNPCLLINDFITPHEILNLRGQKCCKINVCQIGSGNEKGDNNGKHSCQCVLFTLLREHYIRHINPLTHFFAQHLAVREQIFGEL